MAFIPKILGLVSPNEVKLGQHNVLIDFESYTDPESGAHIEPAAILGDYEEPIRDFTAAGIESAVRAVVARKVADDQIDIDRARLIEDVRRALGN